MGHWLTFLVLLLTWLVATPVHADLACRGIHGHDVCIVELKRSAKHYWEYRAVIRVDGETRSLELYNCRDRTRLQSDGRSIPFEPDGIGEFVCQLFKG